MDRSTFLGSSLLAAAALGAPKTMAQAAAKRANFVMIFVDNVGYGDLGCYGNAEVRPPHIDRLA